MGVGNVSYRKSTREAIVSQSNLIGAEEAFNYNRNIGRGSSECSIQLHIDIGAAALQSNCWPSVNGTKFMF